MRQNIVKRTVGMILAAVMLLLWIPVGAAAEEQAGGALAGKTLSILGDSISTFTNYSNGTAAQTTNSTVAEGVTYYPKSGYEVTAETTWWYQTAEMLGMEILVNNSWSGSCLLKERFGTVGAYVDRCVQLHDDTGGNAGEKPDIIATFMGTNDYYIYPDTLGRYEDIDFDELIQSGENGYIYAQPETSVEAYAIILHKIGRAYPDAQVYCFTLLPRLNSASQPTGFNDDLARLAQRFGATVVDLYDCGIRSESDAFYMLMGDKLHPDNPGMDAITNAFASALLKNNGVETFDVSYTLEDAVSMEGTTRTVPAGESFMTELASVGGSSPLEITVTMGGADITAGCLSGNVVTIPAVDGEVSITARPKRSAPLAFRWETRGDRLVSVTTGGNVANELIMTHGTITDGVYSKARFTMDKSISLRHDLPWRVEWKSSGTWTDTTDGALLFAQSNVSATEDTYYFYRRHKNDFFAFGVRTDGKYHNYGVAFEGTGIDTTAEHVFRLENRISADGSNMIYLLVDDVEVGPMNTHYISGKKQGTDNWVSGKDFKFSYMGTSPHTIGGCSIEYIQVWENGAAHEHDYEAVVTEPTCTEGGYTTYTCSSCGDSYVDGDMDALGHDWSSWVVTTMASGTAEGLKTRNCERSGCGIKQTKVIPKPAQLATPSITKLENTAAGVKITWGKVTGAERYRVYVKSGSKWKNLGNTTGSSFTWTGAKSGETYSFTVRCVSGDSSAFTSAYNTTGWKITYIGQPAISKIENTVTGTKISWKAVAGAEKYRIFMKTDSGWKTLGNTTGTSFTWTGAKAGQTYIFTVRCLNGEGTAYVSSYNSAGWKHKYYPTPEVTKLGSTTAGVKLTWTPINGADKYRVYVKTASGWTKVGTTAGTGFTWTGAKTGQTYSFTVRGINADGSVFVTAHNKTGWDYKYYPAPEVTKLENTSGGIKLTWTPINGAGKYRVYIKTASGWTKVGTTAGTAFTWTGAKAGQTYTFTVRAINADGTALISAYNTTGWTIKRQ